MNSGNYRRLNSGLARTVRPEDDRSEGPVILGALAWASNTKGTISAAMPFTTIRFLSTLGVLDITAHRLGGISVVATGC